MSSSSTQPPLLHSNQPLNITQLSLEGEGAWPDLQVEQLSPQINVFYGPPRSGKSSVAQLVGHLMYGKTESSWRRQFGQSVSTAAGSVQLDSVQQDGSRDDFLLRRHFDTDRQPRLTITSNRGDAVDGQTIQNLLSGLSPQLAAKVFAVDFAESPRADWLLSQTFAREFTNSQIAETATETKRYADYKYSCCIPAESHLANRVDRQRIDELVKRRDTIAGEIQQKMSVRRGESEVLEREINEVDAGLKGKRDRVEQLRLQLHRLDGEIAELETQLRYFSLDLHAKHQGRHLDADLHQRELAELDEEITRSRQTLSDTQQREQFLRAELAQCAADGTADSVTCLSDGRATLGALEQLLDDLDVEVSQLARAHEPGRCIGHDSHAKLSPVAALLRQQVYTLCGQLTEQERLVRRQQLTTESRQLARVQIELGERLDLLLSRRESLIQRSQLANQPARLMPLPPVVDHCGCEHHGEFVQQADAMVLGRADRVRHESDARNQLSVLKSQRTQHVDEFNLTQHDLEQLEFRWENLQRQRASLINGASIEEQQTELERLESVIHQALHTTETRTTKPVTSSWRASDILAQLTDGQLVQIRLNRQEAEPTIVDRRGQLRTLESLSPGEHDQLYLALTLSLVSSYAQRGIQLPLILDEPFLKQNAAHAATMVGVLVEFARAGHQLLVFTEDRETQRRFSALGAMIHDLESLQKTRVAKPITTRVAAPTPSVQTTNTRIIRETYDGHTTPVLRLAPVDGSPEQDDFFYLTETSTFGDFPVLGAETNSLFSRISIHTIGDLLVADATTVASQLSREGITTETVELWQIHMALMCHVPNLTLDDAQVLAANGIDSPDDLYEVDLDSLFNRIDSFLRSDRGLRFQRSSSRYTRSRMSGWRDGARHYRDRWQRSRSRYSNWGSRRSKRSTNTSRSSSQHDRSRTDRQQSESQRSQKQRTERKSRETSRSRRSSTRQRRFYLSRTQDVEDAPSIGPKTASRLAKVGIRTVADLLSADPESTAAELDVSHINAETLAAWQHQARLVCQIPELRGYGAQMLVACGMTQPEQIAGTTTERLIAQVLAFCETKEGQRILRSGEPPQTEKIAEWVELARESRPLEAA